MLHPKKPEAHILTHQRRQEQMTDNYKNESQKNSKLIQVDAPCFESEVVQSRRPVLAAFLADWSQPCRIIEPVLDEIASTCSGKLTVVQIDADANPDLSLWYEIVSIPTLLYFVAGGVRARIVGTASKEAILAKLEAASNTEQNKQEETHEPKN
jgi:thioredoxin 1